MDQHDLQQRARIANAASALKNAQQPSHLHPLRRED
jgi:hypothetical protein